MLAVHICKLLRIVLRFTFLSYNLKNPLNHFRIARTILSSSLSLYFIWSLWMRQHTCLILLRRLANLNSFPNITSFRNKYLHYLVIFLLIALIGGTCVDRAIAEANRKWAAICDGKNRLYQHNFFCFDSTYGIEHYLAKCFYTIFIYFGRFTGQFPRMGLLIIALTLWQVCKSFGHWVKMQARENSGSIYNTQCVLACYEELKEISHLLRKLIGEMVICEILEDIVYFSLEIQLRLRDADWFSILIISETFVMAFLAKLIAACAADHVNSFALNLCSIWVHSLFKNTNILILETDTTG